MYVAMQFGLHCIAVFCSAAAPHPHLEDLLTKLVVSIAVVTIFHQQTVMWRVLVAHQGG